MDVAWGLTTRSSQLDWPNMAQYAAPPPPHPSRVNWCWQLHFYFKRIKTKIIVSLWLISHDMFWCSRYDCPGILWHMNGGKLPLIAPNATKKQTGGHRARAHTYLQPFEQRAEEHRVDQPPQGARHCELLGRESSGRDPGVITSSRRSYDARLVAIRFTFLLSSTVKK